MNEEKQSTTKRRFMRSFQAWESNERLLAIAARTGMNVSELINEALAADAVLEKRIKTHFAKVSKEVSDYETLRSEDGKTLGTITFTR